MIDCSHCYRNRFSLEDLQIKAGVWKVLCGVLFAPHIRPTDTVIDIGAGYGEFINTISCKKKIAVDVSADLKKYARRDVTVLICPAHKIPRRFNATADVVFMSNFLEHLSSKEEIVGVLRRARELLKPHGKILVLQPNIDLVRERYWDFIDHKVALNGASLKEALTLAGFTIGSFVKRCLPYTTKSVLPKEPWFVRLYLALPSWMRLWAGQSFIVAENPIC